MTGALRLLAVSSVLASIVCLGLSGMAADDLSRAGEARTVQLLQLAWLVVSTVTLFVAARMARRDRAAGPIVYAPMGIVSAIALLALARF